MKLSWESPREHRADVTSGRWLREDRPLLVLLETCACLYMMGRPS